MIPHLSGQDFLARFESQNFPGRFPLQAQWEITCRCNLKCVMCYTDCFNTPEHIQRELSTQEIFRILDEMKAAGVMELTLTGGEPMSRPDFKEIYLRAIQNGFLTTLFTNGTYITDEWIRLWQQYPPEKIEISVHGKSETTFDRVTGMSGSHTRVMRSIRLVAESGLPLMIKTTGLNLNQNEILEIKSWAQSLPNVQFRFGFHIRAQANGGTDPYQFRLPEEELAELLARDLEFSVENDKQQSAQEKCPTACHEGKRQFHIDAYGTLQLCSKNRKDGYSLRTGSFVEGFYHYLPAFYCPRKNGKSCTEPQESEGALHATS